MSNWKTLVSPVPGIMKVRRYSYSTSRLLDRADSDFGFAHCFCVDLITRLVGLTGDALNQHNLPIIYFF